jgi:hypothetical protein
VSSMTSPAARPPRRASAAFAVASATVGAALMVAAAGTGTASAGTIVTSATARQPDPSPTDNGMIRVHNPGTPASDRRHEQQVCSFYLAAFDFEPETVAWRIESPGGDAVAQNELQLDAEGHGSTGVMRLPDGQYELSWEASAAARSPANDNGRFFTVACSGQAGPPGPQPSGPPPGGQGGPGGPGADGPGDLGAGGQDDPGGSRPGEAGSPGNGDAPHDAAGAGGRSESSPGDGSGKGGKAANPASPLPDSWSGVRLPAADDPVLAAAIGTGTAFILTAGLVVALRRRRRSHSVAVAAGEGAPATRNDSAAPAPGPPAAPPLPPLPPLPRRARTSIRPTGAVDPPGPSSEGDAPSSG